MEFYFNREFKLHCERLPKTINDVVVGKDLSCHILKRYNDFIIGEEVYYFDSNLSTYNKAKEYLYNGHLLNTDVVIDKYYLLTYNKDENRFIVVPFIVLLNGGIINIGSDYTIYPNKKEAIDEFSKDVVNLYLLVYQKLSSIGSDVNNPHMGSYYYNYSTPMFDADELHRLSDLNILFEQVLNKLHEEKF